MFLTDLFCFFSTDGDPDHHFYIGLEAGNLMVARKLDWETKSMYNLTVQVTDGLSYDNCTVSIAGFLRLCFARSLIPITKIHVLCLTCEILWLIGSRTGWTTINCDFCQFYGVSILAIDKLNKKIEMKKNWKYKLVFM